MKTNGKTTSSKEISEKDVFEALRYYGYKPPMSEQDIEEYIRSFGKTRIELPDSLNDAKTVFSLLQNKHSIHNESQEIIGMAARNGNRNKLPDDLIKKIKKDFKDGKWIK